METYHINETFTDGEMWAILHALSSFLEENMTEEARAFAISAREKIIAAIE